MGQEPEPSSTVHRQPRAEHTPARNNRLPRKLYFSSGHALFLTLHANHGKPFQNNPPLCDAIIRLLKEMRKHHDCWVSAYCLMPDHLHLLCGSNTETADPLLFVERLKGRTTNESWQYGWTGRLWQKRFHDHLLRSATDLTEAEAYILANPTRAGLVTEAEAWRWRGKLDDPR